VLLAAFTWKNVFSLFVGMFGGWQSLSSFILSFYFSAASDDGIVVTMRMAAAACTFEEKKKSSGCVRVVFISGKVCISFFQLATSFRL
jgi:hypothetical protein